MSDDLLQFRAATLAQLARSALDQFRGGLITGRALYDQLEAEAVRTFDFGAARDPASASSCASRVLAELYPSFRTVLLEGCEETGMHFVQTVPPSEAVNIFVHTLLMGVGPFCGDPILAHKVKAALKEAPVRFRSPTTPFDDEDAYGDP
jgi:hypothetical protein